MWATLANSFLSFNKRKRRSSVPNVVEPPLTLLTLPVELQVEIFKRVDSSTLMPVCRALRDLYHNEARSVTLTRCYVLNVDDRTIHHMRKCRKLAKLIAPAEQLKSWHWPTGQLTNLRALVVPAGWSVGEIPPTLSTLEVKVVTPIDIPWVTSVTKSLADQDSRCVVSLGVVSMGNYATWPALESPVPLRIRTLTCNSRDIAERVARLAPALHLRALELRNSQYTTSLAFFSGGVMQHLRQLTLETCSGLKSLDSLAGAGLASLTELRLKTLPLVTLDGLDRACLRSLKKLEVSGCSALTSLRTADGRSGLRFGALSTLRISGAALRDLRGIAGCTALRELVVQTCPQLSSLLGLSSGRGNPALQELRINECSALTTLRSLAGSQLTKLTALEVTGCELTSLEGLEAAGAAGLQFLKVSSPTLQSLAGLQQCALTALTSLDLSACGALASLDSIGQLPSLVELILCRCTSLASLQALVHARLTSLKRLNIELCSRLAGFQNGLLPASVRVVGGYLNPVGRGPQGYEMYRYVDLDPDIFDPDYYDEDEDFEEEYDYDDYPDYGYPY